MRWAKVWTKSGYRLSKSWECSAPKIRAHQDPEPSTQLRHTRRSYMVQEQVQIQNRCRERATLDIPARRLLTLRHRRCIHSQSAAAISPAPGPVHIISSLQHLVAVPSRPGRRCDCTDVDENSATWACEWSHMRHLTSSMLRRLLHSGRLLSMHSDI